MQTLLTLKSMGVLRGGSSRGGQDTRHPRSQQAGVNSHPFLEPSALLRSSARILWGTATNTTNGASQVSLPGGVTSCFYNPKPQLGLMNIETGLSQARATQTTLPTRHRRADGATPMTGMLQKYQLFASPTQAEVQEASTNHLIPTELQ